MKPLEMRGPAGFLVRVQRRGLRWHGEVYHSGYGWAGCRAWSRRVLKQRINRHLADFFLES